jgi:ATP-dependent Clp protease adaptor protein ClpS
MNRKRDFENNPNLEANSNGGKDCTLILYNDDIHDFSYVIESLVEICNHDLVQAEQCTYLVHYRGECEIKTGKYPKLKTFYDKLIEKGLTVSIN